MAADPEPEAPPLGPERSRESLPDESLDLDERAVESPRTEPQDPAGDASHARGVDDASRSARRPDASTRLSRSMRSRSATRAFWYSFLENEAANARFQHKNANVGNEK